MTDSIRVAIDLAAKQAQTDAKNLAKELGGAADAVDDVESAGKRMAAAINQSADDMIAEINDTAAAVKALDDAIAQAGGNALDVDTREVVAKLKKAGLTADDVTADADELAAALKRIDDVKITAADAGFDDLDQALGTTSDNSSVTSTAIGGIGNSLTELPGVSNLGPVAESMGQLAENAMEGDANLKSLAAAGGGLALVGLAIQGVTSHLEEQAAIKAWSRENVDDWTDAIYEAESALEGLTDAYRSAGTIEVKTLLGGIKDITSTLARAGVTVDDWTAAIGNGRDGIDDMVVALDLAGITGQQQQDVMVGLVNAQDQAAEAARKVAIKVAVFGENADVAAEQADDLADSVNAVPDSKNVTVGANTWPAHVALGGVESRLSRISQTITTAWVNVRSKVIGGFARGTQYAPGGVALVGEEGPELVDLPTGSRVTPAAQTAARLAAGRGGNTYNSTTIVNMPAGARPDDVVGARRRYGQVQGTEF